MAAAADDANGLRQFFYRTISKAMDYSGSLLVDKNNAYQVHNLIAASFSGFKEHDAIAAQYPPYVPEFLRNPPFQRFPVNNHLRRLFLVETGSTHDRNAAPAVTARLRFLVGSTYFPFTSCVVESADDARSCRRYHGTCGNLGIVTPTR